MTRQKLIELGWTEESLRERVLSYWQYQRRYKTECPDHSKRSYRVINAGLYLRDKNFLRIFIENR